MVDLAALQRLARIDPADDDARSTQSICCLGSTARYGNCCTAGPID